MLVFNLTDRVVDFHGKHLSPSGGSAEIPELDGNINNRDKALGAAKVIAFAELPSWFVSRKDTARKAKMAAAKKIEDANRRPIPAPTFLVKSSTTSPPPAPVVANVSAINFIQTELRRDSERRKKGR